MSEDLIQVPIGLTTDGLLARRYMARVLDSIIIGMLIVGALSLLRAVGPQAAGDVSDFFAILILWIGYGAILESSPWQATLGKRLIGLRVYDSQGGRLKVVQAAGRNLVKDGPFLLLTLIPGGRLLSFIWLGAHLVVLHRSPVYQAIHDRTAGTWVAAPEETTQLRLT
jgi:uncharacterized RDD family membrane protein YckC